MIFLVQFGLNKYFLNFSKTTNCTRSTGSCNFVSLKTFTRAYLFQIALQRNHVIIYTKRWMKNKY